MEPALAHGPGISYRFWQFFQFLSPFPDWEASAALRALLKPELHGLASRLSGADQRHLLAVHRRLLALGWRDPDLLQAALLHDIGKTDDAGRVTLAHRSARVVLEAVSPALLRKLSVQRSGWIGHGLYLSLYHAELGSALARNAGASERTGWLIAHHHDDTIHVDLVLSALRDADAGGYG